MSRVDLEEQVRYRRKMLERHRRVGAVAQGKAVEWLNTLTSERIAKMSVADATRLLDVAVKIEREACPAVGVEELPEPYSEPAPENGCLKQRLIEAGLNDVEISDLARFLSEFERGTLRGGAASPRETGAAGREVSEPQADDAAPLEPEPGDETPPESIWTDRWQPGVGRHGSPR
jgi:hypothetical protein